MIYENECGLKTYYEEYGDKYNPTLLLLHGIGADNRMWDPQKELYASKGYHVIVPDLLGHGKSSPKNNLSLSDWNKQLSELLTSLNIEKISLIGVSMGGVIAQSFAVNNPKRIEKLIISDSFGELKTMYEKFLGLSQVVGFKLFKILGNQMFAKAMAATYKPKFAYRARTYFQDVCLKVDFNQLVLARKAINTIDTLNQLKKLKVPSLVMVGDQFGQSFIKINKKIADALDTELIIIKNSMDPSNLVNPDQFNKNVVGFLTKNGK